MKRQTRAILLNAFTGIAIAATAALVLLPTVASAAPGSATAFVNVRAQVVNTLNAGETVDIQECQGAWCYVVAAGNDGWVAARFLSNQPGGSVNFGITGPNGNTIQFGVNVPAPNNPPPVVDDEPIFDDAEVCFYSRSQYRGNSFCVEPGDEIADLAGWDGEISSIENPAGYDVEVCTRTRFRGDCRTYTTSSKSLGAFDNAIASLSVD
jgi:uncharacterized protein YraI